MHKLEDVTWAQLYETVLTEGLQESPRGRPTIALNDVVYSMRPGQHFDANPVRKLSLDYVFREFLWFTTGNGYDLRMANYAPIWKTCIDGGKINSNYGQYFFSGRFSGPFFHALDLFHYDIDTRRAWVPIFNSAHQDVVQHDDYPCTTGIGFSVRGDDLQMNVHMRSQDLWWGAANDEPVCYLLQLLAQAYLKYTWKIDVDCGPIVHYIDNLHFYERHIEPAYRAISISAQTSMRQEVIDINELAKTGFNQWDIMRMFNINMYPIGELLQFSPFMQRVLDIPGDYGFNDTLRSW